MQLIFLLTAQLILHVTMFVANIIMSVLSIWAHKGYLTAESTRGASSGDRVRRNRSNQRSTKDKTATRSSRSLSRSNVPKNVTIQMPKNAKATPQERRMAPPTYGFVTPKVSCNRTLVQSLYEYVIKCHISVTILSLRPAILMS